MTSEKQKFDCHLPRLLDEAVKGSESGAALRIPVNVTKSILRDLAKCAIKLDDPALHILMLRLGLYDVSAKERVDAIKRMETRVALEGVGE